jgi:hypothetical protein
MGALLGLAFWKNSQSYPHKPRLWILGKAVIETGLVVLMVIYAPALLLMYVVIWLTSPFRNKIIQVTPAFAAPYTLHPSGSAGLHSGRGQHHDYQHPRNKRRTTRDNPRERQ